MKKSSAILTLAVALLGAAGIAFDLMRGGPSLLMFYTLLSNIAVTGFCMYRLLLRRPLNSTEWRVKGGLVIAILLTCLVYNILLAPLKKPAEHFVFHNLALHYAVPILFVIDWLLFDPKDNYRPFDPLRWTIFPLCYVGFALFNGLVLRIPIHGAKDSPFPYFFLNVAKRGWSGVLTYTVIIAALYILMGYGIYSLKRHHQINA